MKRFLQLLFSFLFMSAYIHATNFSKEWAQVDRLLAEDLPQKAAQTVGGIYDLAFKEQADQDLLRAALFLTRTEQSYSEYDYDRVIGRFNAILPLMKGERAALCHAYLADCYKDRRNSDEFSDSLRYHLEASITTAVEECMAVQAQEYEGLFFQGSNREWQKLKPSLYQQLLNHALIGALPYTPREERELLKEGVFGTMQEFVTATGKMDLTLPGLWNLKVLRLLALSTENSNVAIKAWADYRRLNMLEETLRPTPRLAESYRQLGEAYLESTSYATRFLYEAALKLRANSDNKQACSLCKKAMAAYPKSAGAVNCENLLAEITAPDLTIRIHDSFAANKPNIFSLEYRNAGKVHFRAIKLEEKMKSYLNDKELERILSMQPVSWEEELPLCDDYCQERAFLATPALESGYYALIASTDSKFGKESPRACMGVTVSDILFIYGRGGENSRTAFLLNRSTGAPLSNCSYTIRKSTSAGYETIMEGVSDEKGTIPVPELPGGKCEILLSWNGQHITETVNPSYHSEPFVDVNAAIFTDRYKYRPGEEVNFSAIIYEGDGITTGGVLEKKEVSVSLLDANRQETGTHTLTTDLFGKVHGTFSIPTSALQGYFSIVVRNERQIVIGRETVLVESFKQPGFKVEFEESYDLNHFDKELKVRGRVVSYTGVPIADAKVEYSVNGVRDGVVSLHDYRKRDEMTLSEGELTTQADGSFEIEFTALREELAYSYTTQLPLTVHAKVTDLNGETHAAMVRRTVSDYDRTINVDAPDFLPIVGTTLLNVTLANSAGAAVQGDYTVKVFSAASPEEGRINIHDKFPYYSLYGEREKKPHVSQNIEELFPYYDFEMPEYEETVLKRLMKEAPMQVIDATFSIAAPSPLRLPALETGLYWLLFESPDARPKLMQVAVAKGMGASLPSQAELTIQAPADTFCVGDTARVYFCSPIKGTSINYFMESKEKEYAHASILSTGGIQELLVPITEDMLYGVRLFFFTAFENMVAVESCTLNVDCESAKRLNVRLVTMREYLEPDSEEHWELEVTDSKGNPVKAQLMLTMYDEASDLNNRHNWYFAPWNRYYFTYRNLYTDKSESSNLLFQRPSPWKKVTQPYPCPGVLIPLFEYAYSEELVIMSALESSFGSVHARGLNSVALSMAAPAATKAVVLHDEGPQPESDGIDITPRTNRNPTALWRGAITTDSLGKALLEFKAPQLLTSWVVKAFAHTPDLKFGSYRTETVTRKELMIESAAPRFLRQGDVMEFSTKVMNITSRNVKAVVTLNFKDALTGKSLKMIDGAQSKRVGIEAQGSAPVSFKIRVPEGVAAITCTLTAATSTHTDGEQTTLPVLADRTMVVQSLNLFNNGAESRKFVFEELKGRRSSTIRDEKLTLEYSSNPLWYAIQALPYLISQEDPTNIALFHSFFANTLTAHIIKTHPSIETEIRKWMDLPPTQRLTELEKNQELKQTLLEETPWVLISKSEKETLKALAQALNLDNLESECRLLLQELLDRQNSDGSWSWISGFSSSPYVTELILMGMGSLLECGALDLDGQKGGALDKALNRAVFYVDSNYAELYNKNTKDRKSIGEGELHYLLARSYLSRYNLRKEDRKAYDYYSKLALDTPTHDLSLYTRAALSLLLARTNHTDAARKVLATLVDRSLYSDELGRYWRDNTAGYLWHEAPVELQSLIIEALQSVGGYPQQVAECRRWLLKQRQTTHWGSTPATARAIMALIAGDDMLVEERGEATVKIGDERLTLTPATGESVGADYFTHTWEGPIKSDMAEVEVTSTSKNISWGAVYRVFTDVFDNITESSTGLDVKRELYRVKSSGEKGETLELVKEKGHALKVGDRVRVRLLVSTDRNLEYVEVKDMRAACMEPENSLPGMRWNYRDSLRYYMAPGDNSTKIFCYNLPKGKYVMEYDMFVTKAGSFEMGITTLQCMYAPQFRANSGNRHIIVE